MSIYTPYVYLIGWTKLNRWYYGCSYARGNKIANPNQLWTTYFTSSKIVKNFRKKYGEPDIVEIRKTFKTAIQAQLWEARVIYRMQMVGDEKFLNQRDMSGHFHNKGGYKHSEASIKNYKKSFDEERRIALSKWSIKNNSEMSPESRKKAGINGSETKKENREKYIGSNNHCYGIERTSEHKKNISEGTKKAMSDPTLIKHLSKKAKQRCTPEWRKNKSENNKLKVCCVRCRIVMGKSSIGRHRLGKKCIPVYSQIFPSENGSMSVNEMKSFEPKGKLSDPF
jgi:hypothetical protein